MKARHFMNGFKRKSMSNRRLKGMPVIIARGAMLPRCTLISGVFRIIYLSRCADFIMMAKRTVLLVPMKEALYPFSPILHLNRKGRRKIGIMNYEVSRTIMERIEEDIILHNSSTRFLNNGGGWTMSVRKR